MNEVSNDVAEEIVEGVSENTNGEIVNEVSNDVAGEIVEGVSNDVAGEIVEGVSENTNGEIVEEASENTNGEIVEGVSENTNGEIVEEASENTNGEIVEEASENTNGEIVEDVSENVAEEIVEGVSENTNGEIVEEISENVAGEIIDVTSDVCEVNAKLSSDVACNWGYMTYGYNIGELVDYYNNSWTYPDPKHYIQGVYINPPWFGTCGHRFGVEFYKQEKFAAPDTCRYCAQGTKIEISWDSRKPGERIVKEDGRLVDAHSAYVGSEIDTSYNNIVEVYGKGSSAWGRGMRKSPTMWYIEDNMGNVGKKICLEGEVFLVSFDFAGSSIFSCYVYSVITGNGIYVRGLGNIVKKTKKDDVRRGGITDDILERLHQAPPKDMLKAVRVFIEQQMLIRELETQGSAVRNSEDIRRNIYVVLCDGAKSISCIMDNYDSEDKDFFRSLKYYDGEALGEKEADISYAIWKNRVEYKKILPGAPENIYSGNSWYKLYEESGKNIGCMERVIIYSVVAKLVLKACRRELLSARLLLVLRSHLVPRLPVIDKVSTRREKREKYVELFKRDPDEVYHGIYPLLYKKELTDILSLRGKKISGRLLLSQLVSIIERSDKEIQERAILDLSAAKIS